MRIAKIVLVFTLIAVTVLYGMTTLSDKLSGENTPPTISCSGDTLEVSVHDGESVLLSGVTASDSRDGDLTASIYISGTSQLVSDDTVQVTYLVFDSDNNMATLTRSVRYTDYASPRFSLSEPLVYHSSESIALLDRLSITDVKDGDITSSVRVSSLVSTSDPEIYTMDVQVTNSLGDTVSVTLPVIILSDYTNRPTVNLTDNLIYLEQGSTFNARSYLSSVETPEGYGSKNEVEISGAVNTAVPGTYLVSYTYSYNNTSGLAILTVVVE